MTNYRLVDSLAELQGCRNDWLWLEENSNNVNVFQSYDWIDTWWRHFGKNRDLKVILAKDNGNLITAAPFFVEKRRILGVPVKRVAVVGDDLSTNHEFIFSGNDYTAIGRCLTTLLSQVDSWDYVELKKVPEQSSTAKAVKEICSYNGFHHVDLPYHKYPFLELNGDYQTFLKESIKRRNRKSLRNSVNRLKKAGQGQFVHTGEMEWDHTFNELLRLGEKSWKHRDGVDPLTRTLNRDFFRDLSVRFREKDMLSLTALDLNGSRIAFILGFVLRGKFTAYYLVFDENMCSLSPGKIILAHIIEKAFSEGLSEIDFSEGEQHFKYHWTKNSRQFQEVYLLNRNSPRYYLLATWLKMRRKIKTNPKLLGHVSRLKRVARKK